MGFNARQIDAGFCRTAEGDIPFQAQAIADALAPSRIDAWQANGEQLLMALRLTEGNFPDPCSCRLPEVVATI